MVSRHRRKCFGKRRKNKETRSLKVKYLGLYLIGGANFRIDLNVAKQKYYGCFNNIKSVVRQQVNELMILKLVKTYCLPRLLYGCAIWPTETLDMHEFEVIWNKKYVLWNMVSAP